MASQYGIDIQVNPSGAVSGSRTAKRSLQEVEQAADKTKSSISGVVSGLGGFALEAAAGVASVAALAAGVRASIQANRQFEKSLSDLSAITGATGDQLAYLKAQAQQIGATTSLSASEAAEAFKLIASAKPDLLESSAALNEVTRAAVTLAEAAGTSLPDAANTLGSALNQFGAGAEEASRFINVLAAGAKFGAAEVEQVAESLKNAGVSAASAGVSFEEANAAIQALAAVSIKGGEAGTALRNIILKLETDVDQKLRPSVVGLSGALEELAKRNEDTAALTQRFGLENINAAQALLTNVDNVRELTGQLTGTSTALEQAAIRTNNLDGDIKQLSSSSEALALALGEKLNPAVRAITQAMTVSSTAAANWLDSIGEMPTTVDGATLRLANMYEEMASLRDAAQKLRTDGSGLFGPTGLDIKKAEEYEAKLADMQVQSAKLTERLLKLKGSGFGGADAAPSTPVTPSVPPPVALPTTSAEGQKALEALKQQAELAKLSGEARARLAAIQKLGTAATAEERAEAEQLATQIYRLDEAQKAATKSASEQAKSAEEVKRQQEANVATVAKLREELTQAALSGGELAQRQAEMSLNQYATPEQVQQVRDLAAAISDLEDRKRLADEAEQIRRQTLTGPEQMALQFQMQQQVLQDALNAKAITEQQYYETSAALNERYNEEIAKQEAAANSARLQAGAQLFDGLAGIAGTFAGEQSGVYKALFAASKAFAIADAIIKIQQGIANAAALPFPANLAAMGTVAAATGSIVSTISGTQMSGFQSGGYTGNMGTSQVAGVVHGQEYVMNAEATRRIGVGNLERMSSGGSMQPRISITNNYANGVEVTTKQLSEGDVEIIVDRRMAEQMPDMMTAELSNPYSDSRAVLSSSYSIQRNTVR